MFNSYLFWETIEGNLMVIATGSYQLALVAVYFDSLPLEEATDPKFYMWILAYNIIMLPLQLIGFKYLY